MRSRAVRWAFGAMAFIAIGAASLFLFTSEQQLVKRRAAVRVFDLQARDVIDALWGLRAAQQAYVAAGQGIESLMPKVDETLAAAADGLAALQASTTSAAAKSALEEAASSVSEFRTVDDRIRSYVKTGDQLMAADIAFTDGGETAASAARQVERARLEERQALDADDALAKQREAAALGGLGALLVLVVVALLPLPRLRQASSISSEAQGISADPDNGLALRLDDRREPKPVAAGMRRPETGRATAALKAAADLCTDLARANDADELRALLGKAAEVLDASGLVLWVATEAGGELRPALAHGYSAETMARLPSIARSSNNAAGAAYRSGRLQIVLSKPGSPRGAVVAPVLTADGCTGVLSAEIRDGGEASDSVQAIAAIVAAQLAGVLTAAPAPAQQRAAGGVV